LGCDLWHLHQDGPEGNVFPGTKRAKQWVMVWSTRWRCAWVFKSWILATIWLTGDLNEKANSGVRLWIWPQKAESVIL
jgi:hypothetical protein